MVVVGRVASCLRVQRRPQRRRDDAHDQAAGQPSRALVPAARHREQRTSHLPDAAFLAHLIATEDGAPQTRLRRRADWADAAAAYAAAVRAIEPPRGTVSLSS